MYMYLYMVTHRAKGRLKTAAGGQGDRVKVTPFWFGSQKRRRKNFLDPLLSFFHLGIL